MSTHYITPEMESRTSGRGEVALEVILEAGRMLIAMGGQLDVRLKPDRTPVTDADIAINDLFVSTIRGKFPEDSIIGEERSDIPAEASGFRWIIDPIDGTENYANGGIDNGVAVALTQGNELIFGSFYNPSRQELFYAVRGLGAFINGRKLQVNSLALHEGMPYDYCFWPGAMVDARLFHTFGPPLDQDSISNKACRVAEGRSVFAVFPGRWPHDVLPGAIIVEEAGGTVTDAYGDPIDVTADRMKGGIYSNTVVHDEVLTYLQKG